MLLLKVKLWAARSTLYEGRVDFRGFQLDLLHGVDLRHRRCLLEMSMNGDVSWGFDPKSYAVASHFENGDLDVIGNHDLLIFLSTDNQHSSDSRCYLSEKPGT